MTRFCFFLKNKTKLATWKNGKIKYKTINRLLGQRNINVTIHSRSHKAAKVGLWVCQNDVKAPRNKLRCSDLLSGVPIGVERIHKADEMWSRRSKSRLWWWGKETGCMHPVQVFVLLLLLLFAQGTGWFSVSCTARGGDGRSGHTSSARSIFNDFLIISCGIWLCLQSLRSPVIARTCVRTVIPQSASS